MLVIADHSRIVRLWLLIVAALIIATVLVGGGTRLTGSGLSIVEWRPVTGVVPPGSEAQWTAELEKYKGIPQFKIQNSGITLSEFKVIYWWEWSHRLLGRLIGVVFLLPFLFFLWRGWIEPRLRMRLWIVFALGALQGAVGWWMVASGLTERVSVSQYRLAFHLTLACIIYAAILWTHQELGQRDAVSLPAGGRPVLIVVLCLTFVQIYLGALVAGMDAGLTYNTWPLMDGVLIPPASDIFVQNPVWRNFFENPLTVQFNHRAVAYLLCAVALTHAIVVWRAPNDSFARNGALVLTASMILQAVIGILTLLHAVPLGLGLLHQAGAMLVLTIAVVLAARSYSAAVLPRTEALATRA